ncbi:MAG: PrsW family intramembrane metalloprotease [Halobacteriota archaeon]
MTSDDAEVTDELSTVVTWQPAHVLDRLAVRLHASIVAGIRWLLIVTALGILAAIALVTGLSAVTDPVVFALVLLSAVPALGIAAFVWLADVGADEPLVLVVATFLLGMLFAAFAAVLNTLGFVLVEVVPLVSMLLFFYLIVGPVEEGVKLLAVRLFAFRHPRFDAVIDGAVYGAAAGLGFATIENALYITAAVDVLGPPIELIDQLGETTAVRAMAGPGHVIYSAIAGYFLGMAKFNPRYAGPLVIKGIAIAAIIHATYNVTVQTVPTVLVELTGVTAGVALIAFVVTYDGLAAYYLYRKLSRYRGAYRRSREQAGVPASPELTEFDAG